MFQFGTKFDHHNRSLLQVRILVCGKLKDPPYTIFKGLMCFNLDWKLHIAQIQAVNS